MKKILVAFSLLLLSFGSVTAQTTIGVKGGLNVATIRTPGRDIDPITGVHVGLFASTPISGSFALQPEVLYSLQGVKTNDNTYHFHYLNVPLIFKGTISGGLHAQVGPQFGVLLAANQKSGKNSRDITDSRNRFDGAVALGLGYDVSSWQVSARYNLGLSDTRDDPDEGMNHSNQVFQLSLGYKIR